MRESTYQQIRVISCHDPTEFQSQFNEAMQELASKNPKVDFNMACGHCAYITYQERKSTPETAEDEFYTMGIKYHCRNCPRFEWPTTKSGEIHRIQKKGVCPVSNMGVTWRDSDACEYLYKSIINGSITPIQDEDLEDFQLR